MAMPSSPEILLRRTSQGTAETAPTSHALGVDGLASRKGSRYGSILFDLEWRRVVDQSSAGFDSPFSDLCKRDST
jgi:hypothetical protein